MSEPFESVYPDLLRTGLEKLRLLDARRESLALFSALEHFRRDLHVQESRAGILQVSQGYVAALNLFRASGFWLVHPEDFHFELVLAAPEAERPALEQMVGREIKGGRFASALRQSAPFFFQAGTPDRPERGVFHPLALSTQVMGMFCGLLPNAAAFAQEVPFSLLSLLLGECADALAALDRTKQLTSQIETLSGLLPLCAWCKKVRNDSGYWEQIEKYISTRSGAFVTHGVCPDCRRKFLQGTSG
jgi:hypothetical protein